MTIIAQYKDLRVHEFSGGYEVEHIPTGRTHWMPDGVDQYIGDYGKGPMFLLPGTKTWNIACQQDMESTYSDWLSAYFPDLSIDREDA